ncbi:MAG: 2-amino-4-hydroxy-6-hydroxymethyldihydropteridine diphosphokinase [Candidatus Solibacter usitatus]|nr:2-amino-4-hydroxy-6-hydroxymethyldihydropteridine diphosphokinase [Candidatus Solibacter usitatus]
MKTVYLSLGSNVGDREQMLRRALDELASPEARVVRVSSIYETEPVGLRNQRWFLNAVAEVRTDLFPVQLLNRIQRIELQLGRKRGVDQGPRSIDIDILFFGSFVIRTGRLATPHPRAEERRFVLAPMAELAPEYRHPVSHRTMRELLGGLSGQEARKVLPPSWYTPVE